MFFPLRGTSEATRPKPVELILAMHCRLLARLRPSGYQAPRSPVDPGLLKSHQLVHIAHLLQQSHENCTADFGDCGRAAD